MYIVCINVAFCCCFQIVPKAIFSQDFVFVFPDPGASFIFLQSEADNDATTFQSNDLNTTVMNGEGVLAKTDISLLDHVAFEVTVDSTESIALLLEGN